MQRWYPNAVLHFHKSCFSNSAAEDTGLLRNGVSLQDRSQIIQSCLAMNLVVMKLLRYKMQESGQEISILTRGSN